MQHGPALLGPAAPAPRRGAAFPALPHFILPPTPLLPAQGAKKDAKKKQEKLLEQKANGGQPKVQGAGGGVGVLQWGWAQAIA